MESGRKRESEFYQRLRGVVFPRLTGATHGARRAWFQPVVRLPRHGLLFRFDEAASARTVVHIHHLKMLHLYHCLCNNWSREQCTGMLALLEEKFSFYQTFYGSDSDYTSCGAAIWESKTFADRVVATEWHMPYEYRQHTTDCIPVSVRETSLVPT